jgi:hypothetical protein
MEQLHHPSAHEVLNRLLTPQPTVIGIEGGPCGGKTTLVEKLVKEARELGRNVVVLEEVAGEFINALPGGAKEFAYILENDRPRFIEIEIAILNKIIEKIKNALEEHEGTDTLILADRSTVKPYLTAEENEEVLAAIGYNQSPHVSLVHTMVYLPSVARESREKYEELKATNSARYETSDVAIQVCTANFDAVKDHPELHVLWGAPFDEKIAEAVELIFNPTREIEAKFEPSVHGAVEAMLETKLESGEYITSAAIEQSYHILDDTEYRLRKNTNENGAVVYYCSFKEVLSSDEKEEKRQAISRKDYEILAEQTCIGRLEKTRHSFFHTDEGTGKRRVWVADEYNYEDRFWNLEIEVSSVD